MLNSDLWQEVGCSLVAYNALIQVVMRLQLAALPSLNSLGSSPPPSSQQLQSFMPLEAGKLQAVMQSAQLGQGYEGPSGPVLQDRAPSLSIPLGVTRSEPGQSYDGSREATLEYRAPSLTFPTGELYHLMHALFWRACASDPLLKLSIIICSQNAHEWGQSNGAEQFQPFARFADRKAYKLLQILE